MLNTKVEGFFGVGVVFLKTGVYPVPAQTLYWTTACVGSLEILIVEN